MLRFTPRCAVAENVRLCCDCWESSEDTEERVVGMLVDGSREKVCSCWGRTGVEKREEEKDLAETIADLVALVCSVNGLALEWKAVISAVLGVFDVAESSCVPVHQGPGSGCSGPDGGRSPAAKTKHYDGPNFEKEG